MSLYNDSLNDEPVFERVESFAGGVDAFKRSTLIDPDQSQLLENIIVRDNYEARTRPGIESLGPLARPVNLVAAVVNTTTIGLTWQDTTLDETGFTVYRSTASNGVYSSLGSVGAGVTAYNDTTGTPNTTYYYKVLATTPNGNTPFSNIASATTLPALPDRIDTLATSPLSVSAIDLSWVNPIGGVVDALKVYRATSLNGTYTLLATLSSTTSVYHDSGLTDGTYYYRVDAVNITGATEGNIAIGTTFPTSPTGLALTAGLTSMALAWTNTSATQTQIAVYRATALAGPYTQIDFISGSAVGYTDTGLTQGVAYYYYVVAHNPTGDSVPSNTATATTLTLIAPAGVTATPASSSTMSLAWTHAADSATSLVVSRATVSGGPYTDIATLATSATTYTDTGLTELTPYYYKVSAVYGATTAASAEASGTTWSTGVTVASVLAPGSSYFFSGASIAAGTYRLVYVNGAYVGAAGLYNVNQGSTQGFYCYYNGGAANVKCPGLIAQYATQAAAESANGAGLNSTYLTLVHTGGTIRLNFSDSTYIDNVNGVPNSTFRLIKQ